MSLGLRRAVTWSIVVVAIVDAAWFSWDLAHEWRPRPPVGQPIARRHLVTVPALEGLTALEGYRVLVRLGLRLGKVKPAPGAAGRIVRTIPSSGARVLFAEPIDLFVGVPSGRLQDRRYALLNGDPHLFRVRDATAP